MTDERDIIIGIDLGTTNSLVAYADEAGPRLIAGPAGGGDVLPPSVVAFEDVGRGARIGREARAHAVERPTTTVYSIKRLMGKGVADLAGDLRRLPYGAERRSGEDGRDVAAGVLRDQRYTP